MSSGKFCPFMKVNEKATCVISWNHPSKCYSKKTPLSIFPRHVISIIPFFQNYNKYTTTKNRAAIFWTPARRQVHVQNSHKKVVFNEYPLKEEHVCLLTTLIPNVFLKQKYSKGLLKKGSLLLCFDCLRREVNVQG